MEGKIQGLNSQTIETCSLKIGTVPTKMYFKIHLESRGKRSIQIQIQYSNGSCLRNHLKEAFSIRLSLLYSSIQETFDTLESNLVPHISSQYYN